MAGTLVTPKTISPDIFCDIIIINLRQVLLRMGNKQPTTSTEEHPLRSSHPRLQGARLALLNGQPSIKITAAVSEKEYGMWA